MRKVWYFALPAKIGMRELKPQNLNIHSNIFETSQPPFIVVYRGAWAYGVASPSRSQLAPAILRYCLGFVVIQNIVIPNLGWLIFVGMKKYNCS